MPFRAPFCVQPQLVSEPSPAPKEIDGATEAHSRCFLGSLNPPRVGSLNSLESFWS